MSQPLLELRNVTKVFKIGGGLGLISRRTIKAVNSVSFSVPSDKPVITALVGESGGGKTTISRMILGHLEPTSGEVFFKGRKSSEWVKKSRMEYLKEVQPIFQDPYGVYNPFYRIERVLEVAIKKFGLVPNKEEARQLMIMMDLGLRSEDLLGRYPHQLSGGERQRFMLTRVLMIKPRLIVADEPVSMIDMSLRAIYLNHLISFKDALGTSCLYIAHDLNIASYVADNVVVLCHGRVVEDGPKDAVIEEPLHPYTKLLVSSIPNARMRWKERTDLASIESVRELKTEKGAIFSPRCQHTMSRCKMETPDLVKVDSNRRVACYLH